MTVSYITYLILCLVLLAVVLPIVIVNNHTMNGNSENARMVDEETVTRELLSVTHPELYCSDDRKLPCTSRRGDFIVDKDDKAVVAVCISGSRMEMLARTLPMLINSIVQPIHVFVCGYVSDSDHYMLKWASDTFNVRLYNEYERSLLKTLQHVTYSQRYVVPLYYNIKTCNNMMRNHEIKFEQRYKFVLRIRPDVALTDVLDFSTFECNPNKVYTFPYDEIWHTDNGLSVWGSNELGVNDQIFFSDSDTMCKICDAYDSLDDTTLKHPDFSEPFLYAYLARCNISTIDTHIGTKLLRTDS